MADANDDGDGAFALRFERVLRERFGIDAPAVAAAVGGRAWVAGSLPLQVELGETWPASDMDVYAHARDVPRVLAALLLHGDYEHVPWADVHVGPYVSSGFLSRNGIKGIATLRKAGSPDVQVMAVRHRVPLHDVVANFDLSPCAVACTFDGQPRFLGDGASREAVRARTGCLRPAYHSLYFHCNPTLHARLAKYASRGFVVRVPEFASHAASVLVRRAVAPTVAEVVARRTRARHERFERVLAAEAATWVRSSDADCELRTRHKQMLRKAFDETRAMALSYDSEDEHCVERVPRTTDAAAAALEEAAKFARDKHVAQAKHLASYDTRVFTRNADAILAEVYDTDPPPELVCPISRHVMAHPVRCGEHWYEWACLDAWFSTSETSPLTRQEVEPSEVLQGATSADALALHRRILRWRQQHRIAPRTAE